MSGIYECEFDGIGWSLDSGYTRDWSGHIDGVDNVNEIQLCTTADGGNISVRLGFNPVYFMSNPDAGVFGAPVPKLIYYYDNAKTGEVSFTDNAAVIEEYGVKIISYEYDEPFENEFGLFK